MYNPILAYYCPMFFTTSTTLPLILKSSLSWIKIGEYSCVDSDNKAKQCVKACEGLLDGDSKKLVVKDLLRWNERYEEICEEIGAEIKNSEKDFLFHVESWGQLEPLEILNHGSDILDTKLDEFITLLNKSK